MRFLMVSTFYPPYNFGGDGIYVQRLATELARRGHDVDVLHCADAFEIFRRTRARAEQQPRLRVHTLRSGVRWLSPLLTQQTGRAFFKKEAIRRLVEAERFDVIHYHNLSLIGLDAVDAGDAIKLYTTHEHWLVCPTHVLWRYNREACTRQTCLTCQIASGRPPQWWRYTSFGERHLRHIDRFLCPSRFTLNKHRELGFAGPMTHLPYFLPTPRPSAAGASPHGRPYALFVGRLEKIKGVQNLIGAFRTYHECDLVIAGDGNYGRHLRALARDLPHVVFLGRLAYDELARWYRHALAVVVPSICYEVFGIIILEGFAVSTPALVTPYGALPEVIEDSGGGIVYHTDEELVESLERLRADRAFRDELGRKGRDAFERLWSEDPHIERYLSIIDELATARSAR